MSPGSIVRSFLLLGALAPWLIAPAGAQAPEHCMSAFVTAGPVLPIGELAESWRRGVHLGGGVSVPLVRWAAVRVDLDYSRFPADAQALGRDFEDLVEPVRGGDAFGMTASAALELHPLPRRRLSPYLVLGGGFSHLMLDEYIAVTEDFRYESGESFRNRAGAVVGAGVALRLGAGLRVIAEGRASVGVDRARGLDAYLPGRLGVSFRP